MRLPSVGHKGISLCPAHLKFYLTNVDPKTNAVVLIPISAMVMVITILMIIAVLVTISVLVAIMRQRLGGSAQKNGGNEKSYCQQCAAFVL
jgi:hypothetical protein